MLQYLSLFSGIGAFEKALDRLGVKYNLVNYCEIDKHASKSYAVVHGVSESLNLGDITKVNTSTLPHIDLITYGFPCQDISTAGYQKGLFNEDGTPTRSGLFFEALRIIEDTKPKVAIAENVKNLIGKRFTKQFAVVLDSLEAAGYNNYWQVLNAKDYGIPQNRERVFIVSIRKDVDTGSFNFPEPFELKLKLKDLLEESVDEKYYLKNDRADGLIKNFQELSDFQKVINCGNVNPSGKGQNGSVIDSGGLARTVTVEKGEGQKVLIREATKKGYAEAYAGDSINFEQPSSKTRRGRVGKQIAQTINTTALQGVVTISYAHLQKSKITDVSNCIQANYSRGFSNNNPYPAVAEPAELNLRIRKLTPLECWRLMGFDDEDFYKAEKVSSNTQLYKQAGNSIVVDVLEYLFEKIMEVIDVKKVEEVRTITYECTDLIDVALLKEKEPELYEELLADYPAENATYIFKNQIA